MLYNNWWDSSISHESGKPNYNKNFIMLKWQNAISVRLLGNILSPPPPPPPPQSTGNCQVNVSSLVVWTQQYSIEVSLSHVPRWSQPARPQDLLPGVQRVKRDIFTWCTKGYSMHLVYKGLREIYSPGVQRVMLCTWCTYKGLCYAPGVQRVMLCTWSYTYKL